MKQILIIASALMFISCSSTNTAYCQDHKKSDVLNIEMVSVDGGTYQMGDDEGTPIEKPIHTVNISSFYIAKYEVTQELWNAVMDTKPSMHKGCDKCPVENVTWNDVQDFIDKFNKMTGKRYRLPTEAEWEFAARGGTATHNYKYSGSDDIDPVGWNRLNSNDSTHPVGTKQPNELGIYDMCGNVSEWTNDCYDGEYYKTSPVDNPRGPVNGKTRVARGGSILYNSFFCRNSSRTNCYPDITKRDLGFRLVMDK